MEEILRLAQIPTLGLMTATVVWVLWWTMARSIPGMQARHDTLVLTLQGRHEDHVREMQASFIEAQKAQRDAAINLLGEQRSFFERTVKLIEDRSARDFDACEARHQDLRQLMERMATKQEEMSYGLDLLTAAEGRPPEPEHKPPPKGPGTKRQPP